MREANLLPVKATRNHVPVIKLDGKASPLLNIRVNCISPSQGLATYGFHPKLVHHLLWTI